MNKKLIISIITVSVIALLLCAGVFAAIEYFDTYNREHKETIYEQNQNAEKTKVLDFVIPSKAKSDSFIKCAKQGEVLKYKETVVYTGASECDVYTDSFGNEFWYEDGKLTDYKANLDDVSYAIAKYTGEVITEKESTQIATEFIKTVFPKVADGYEIESITYLESEKTFLITFVKKVGEDNFIISDWCFVEVFADGSVTKGLFSEDNLYEKIGKEKVDAISKKKVLKFVEDSFQQKYEKGANYEIQSISLSQKYENYTLGIVVAVTKQDGTNFLDEFNFVI